MSDASFSACKAGRAAHVYRSTDGGTGLAGDLSNRSVVQDGIMMSHARHIPSRYPLHVARRW